MDCRPESRSDCSRKAFKAVTVEAKKRPHLAVAFETDFITDSERAYCDTSIKRLEKGHYEFPTDRDSYKSPRSEIRAEELMLLLEGIDLGSVKRRPRYERPVTNTAAARSSL